MYKNSCLGELQKKLYNWKSACFGDNKIAGILPIFVEVQNWKCEFFSFQKRFWKLIFHELFNSESQNNSELIIHLQAWNRWSTCPSERRKNYFTLNTIGWAPAAVHNYQCPNALFNFMMLFWHRQLCILLMNNAAQTQRIHHSRLTDNFQWIDFITSLFISPKNRWLECWKSCERSIKFITFSKL